MARNEDDREVDASAASCDWKSSPLMPGRRTSSTRHPRNVLPLGIEELLG